MMTRTLLLALLLLTPLTGCSSPTIAGSTPVRILAAVPGLTYVDGDPDQGTVDMVSLPLLSYRHYEEVEGRRSSSTWFFPLLMNFSQTDRDVKVVYKKRPPAGSNAKGPPDDWWSSPGGANDRKKRRHKTRRQRRLERERRERDARERERLRREDRASRKSEKKSASTARQTTRKTTRKTTRTSPRRTTRKQTGRLRVESAYGDRRRSETRGSDRPAPRAASRRPKGDGTWREQAGEKRLVLVMKEPVELLKKKPQQNTEVNLLFPLIKLKAQRPGLVALRPKSGGSTVIYELGVNKTEARVLPLFSYERTAKKTSLILWPLLASGYESDETGSYLRLFYFLRIKID